MATGLDAERRDPRSGGEADALVVLVHGYGADGRDLIDLAQAWGAAVPTAAFAAPHAPQPCAEAPMGRQWFLLWDRSEGQLAAGVQEAAALLGGFVAAEVARLGIASNRVALMGFSQGAMLVLEAGLQGAVADAAAILAYSGALLGAPGRAATHPRVLIVHGMEDGVVPVQASMSAASRLAALGVPVESIYRDGLDHGIDEEGLAAGARVLSETLRS